MIILPAVDIKDGRCVRLRQGEADDSTTFYDDPAEPAALWAASGAQYLHVVDLDGAFAGKPINLDTFRRIARKIDIPFEVGGGIRTLEDIAAVLDCGVDRVIIGTKAVEDISFLHQAAKHFPGCIVLGIDARHEKVATRGWTKQTDLRVVDRLEEVSSMPLAAIIYTDIARDGMMKGPNVESTAEVVHLTRHEVIASGGVSTLEDIRALAGIGVSGAIVGRALYDGAFTLEEAIEAAAAEADEPMA